MAETFGEEHAPRSYASSRGQKLFYRSNDYALFYYLKMLETLAKAIVYTMAGYASLGLVFAVPFVCWGVQRLDSEARGSGVGFRLVILPGVAAFWPMFLYRLRRGILEPPAEKTPHRLLSQRFSSKQ